MSPKAIDAARLLVLALSIAGCSSDDPAVPLRAQPSSPQSGIPPQGDGSIPPASRKPALRVVPGEFLVKFKAGTSKAAIASTLSKVSPSRVGTFKAIPGLRHVKTAEDVQLGALSAALGASAQIEYIEPNYIVHTAAVPNDPEYPRLWAMNNPGIDFGAPDSDIDAPEAWDITTGSADVVVGVIDSGVDYTHEDLAANIHSNAAECTPNGVDDDGNGYVDDCHGINAITGSSDPMDDNFHGTHVAGTIGAVGNNGIGVVGVAWNVRILPCKFIGSEGYGSTADAIECMDYIADLKDRGVNIVATNNSWGGQDESRALRDAIVAHRQRGIVFVAAAGNAAEDNDLLPAYPCSDDVANVICVGASGANDARPRFSNWGHRVHLSAPGEGILSTIPGNKYDHADGTSMAAPHVTGAIALLAAQDPTRDWRALKNLVIAGGDPLSPDLLTRTLSGRRLNAADAMTCTNSVVLAIMQPLTPLDYSRTNGELFTYWRALGAAVPLKALHINCASGNGPVTVSVAPTGELVTLRDDGSGSDEVAGDGIYSATWTAQSAGTFTLSFEGIADEPVRIIVDPLLKPGFPVQTTSSDLEYGYLGVPMGSSVLVGNIDADPELEILAAGIRYGPMYAWNHDGSAVTGWPFLEGGEMLASLAELDGDPSSSEVSMAVGYRGMMAFDGNGTMLPGWPQSVRALSPFPTVDVDGDGIDEIIAYPARRADGSLLDPVQDVPGYSGFASAPSVADLDADGEPDFIAIEDDTIMASNRHGMLPGFPVVSEIALPPSQPANVVIGDVDGDGHLEIVIESFEYPQWIGRVLIFSNTGRLKRTLPIATQFASTPALADLDGDGIPEIVVVSQNEIYAWKGTGELLPGWPVSLGDDTGGFMEPVVGDIDGDGYPDIATSAFRFLPYRTGRLYAYDRHGNPITGFPIDIETTAGVMPAAIADIDLDGRNDLIVGTNPDWGQRDGVWAYDLRGPGPYGPIEWGQHLGGANHHGYYELGKNLPNDAYLTTLAHGEGSIAAANGGIACGADCIQRYAKGTSVTLTATPSAQGRFNRWMGVCAGQGNPCTVSIQHYTSVAAQFDSPLTVSVIGAGSGSVSSMPGGISCPDDCTEMFDARTVVTLTATAAEGSDFEGWTGACSGRALTCTVTIDAAHTVTAQFVTERPLTIVSTGTGTGLITSEPAGINCGATCSANFPAKSQVTLTVVPSPDSTFTGWTEPCPYYLSRTCTVTMDMAKTMTATFERKKVLTVDRVGTGHGRVSTLNSVTDPDGGIFCGTRCVAGFDRDSVVLLLAEPEYDSYFVAWTGECAASDNNTNCMIIMNADKGTTARFALKPVLTVAVTGNGTVRSSEGRIACPGPCDSHYPPGSPVTLTATADTGATFVGWGGACSGTAPTCDVTMESAKQVTASFTTVNSGGGGNGGGGSAGGGGGKGGGGAQGLIELLVLLGLLSRRRPS